MAKKKKADLKNGAKMYSHEDTLGSYTGVSEGNFYEKPVQDADDL